MTRRGRVRVGLGWIVLVVSLLFVAWGFWPAHRELRVQPVSDTIRLLPEKRSIRLVFPPRIRLDDTGIVHLNVELESVGNPTPASADEGKGVSGGSASLYDTNKVIVEA